MQLGGLDAKDPPGISERDHVVIDDNLSGGDA